MSIILVSVSFLQIVMLVVAWKLSAENMGFFKLSEWKSGMTFLG